MLRKKTGPHHRPCFNHADFRRPSPYFFFPRLLLFGTVPLKINVVSNLVASCCSRFSVPCHRRHPMFPGYMGGIGGGHLLVGRLPPAASRRRTAVACRVIFAVVWSCLDSCLSCVLAVRCPLQRDSWEPLLGPESGVGYRGCPHRLSSHRVETCCSVEQTNKQASLNKQTKRLCPNPREGKKRPVALSRLARRSFEDRHRFALYLDHYTYVLASRRHRQTYTDATTGEDLAAAVVRNSPACFARIAVGALNRERHFCCAFFFFLLYSSSASWMRRLDRLGNG